MCWHGLGAGLNRQDRRFFCLTSDGELNEGSAWEAALCIAHHKLTNVVWLVDRNHIQGIGRTEEVMALEPLDAKLRAFGFHVVAADGQPALAPGRERPCWPRLAITPAEGHPWLTKLPRV